MNENIVVQKEVKIVLSHRLPVVYFQFGFKILVPIIGLKFLFVLRKFHAFSIIRFAQMV